MRPRYSLRTLLLITTALAVLCCYWFVSPSVQARRFVRAVNSEDYKTADKLSWHASDLSFSKWKDERWGFSANAKLVPWSVRQLLQGRRDILLYMTYFQLDETHETRMHLLATSLGIKKPESVATTKNPVIDNTQRSRQIFNR